MIVYAAIVALSGLIVALAFGKFVPWCSRLIALYWAHFIRERIYSFGEQTPEFRETLIYRDAEWLACVTIDALRRKGSARRKYFAESLRRSKPVEPPTSVKTWRRARYEYELENVFDSVAGIQASSELLDCVVELDRPLLLWLVMSSPVEQLREAVCAPVYLARLLMRRSMRSNKTDRAIASADWSEKSLGSRQMQVAA